MWAAVTIIAFLAVSAFGLYCANELEKE